MSGRKQGVHVIHNGTASRPKPQKKITFEAAVVFVYANFGEIEFSMKILALLLLG